MKRKCWIITKYLHKKRIVLKNALVFSIYLFVFFIAEHLPASQPENISTLHVGIFSGYAMIYGHYADELNNGFALSIFSLSPLRKILYGFFNISIASHELSHSSGSQMYSLAINAGPSFEFSLIKTAGIFICPFGRIEYLHLKANKLDQEENTLKGGFGCTSGFQFVTSPALMGRIGIEYSHIWLSNISFPRITIFGGISYNVLFLPTETKRRAQIAEGKIRAYLKADDAYKEGLLYFENREIYKAKEKFKEAIALNPKHAASHSFLERIAEIEADYQMGSELLEKKKFFAAILPLQRVAQHMNEAKQKLEVLRTTLAAKIPYFEKSGIEAYEKNDYASCIDFLTKLQLIDPENKTAAIYLPRAKKRLQGTKKLQ